MRAMSGQVNAILIALILIIRALRFLTKKPRFQGKLPSSTLVTSFSKPMTLPNLFARLRFLSSAVSTHQSKKNVYGYSCAELNPSFTAPPADSTPCASAKNRKPRSHPIASYSYRPSPQIKNEQLQTWQTNAINW